MKTVLARADAIRLENRIELRVVFTNEKPSLSPPLSFFLVACSYNEIFSPVCIIYILSSFRELSQFSRNETLKIN